MKLRIQGNSLRLRLTQKEVARVRVGAPVESLLKFAPGRSLIYLLEGSPNAETMSATFDGHTIRVTIPMDQLTEWVDSDRVGIESRPPNGIQLLVEKDFQVPAPVRTGTRRLSAPAYVLTWAAAPTPSRLKSRARRPLGRRRNSGSASLASIANASQRIAP
jgi:hypothetical protein